jgi:hypothetical protein
LRRAVLVLVAVALSAVPLHASGASPKAKWIAAWAAPITDSAVATLGSTGGAPANATVRNISFVTLGGNAVRIRVSNAFGGSTPLRIGAASIAVRDAGAGIVGGTSRRITFRGRPGITLKGGTQYAYSDAVKFNVRADQIVAVSLYLPSGTNPGASAANYNTSYMTADGAGNHTRDSGSGAFSGTTGSTYALTAIDVLTTEANGAVVGLGSSTFNGTASTQDTYGRVLDKLAVRVNKMISAGNRKAVISAGIGGDTLHAGLNRMVRDAFTQTGVTGVALYDVNDLSSRTAEQIIDDYRIAIRWSHARKLLVFCPTWPPASQSNPGFPTQERSKLNAWILNSNECDDVVDWASVLEEQTTHMTYRPQYFADSIHPNQAGHQALSDATPLRWFTETYVAK